MSESDASLRLPALLARAAPSPRSTYRERVFRELSGARWSPAVEQAERRARARLREQRGALGPTWRGAGIAAAKTALFTAGPLLLADSLWQRGLAWAALPLVLLAGLGVYGAVAVLHDLAHGSFLPSKRANALCGTLLAPLLGLELRSFRASHLGHHRFSQSPADPKRFGAERSADAHLPAYRTAEHLPALLRPLLWLGAAIARLPPRARHLGYLLASLLFLGPVLLASAGDFSLAGRGWRRPGSWLALAGSAAASALLYARSPALLGLSSLALLLGYSFVFSVFAGHLTPHQVYWLAPRRSALGDALNVSNVHFGRLAGWLGHGFADHHATHHLSTAIPGYRLAQAAAVAGPLTASFQAPPIELLDGEDCSMVFGSLVGSLTRTTEEAWEVRGGGALRRTLTG